MGIYNYVKPGNSPIYFCIQYHKCKNPLFKNYYPLYLSGKKFYFIVFNSF